MDISLHEIYFEIYSRKSLDKKFDVNVWLENKYTLGFSQFGFPYNYENYKTMVNTLKAIVEKEKSVAIRCKHRHFEDVFWTEPVYVEKVKGVKMYFYGLGEQRATTNFEEIVDKIIDMLTFKIEQRMELQQRR